MNRKIYEIWGGDLKHIYVGGESFDEAIKEAHKINKRYWAGRRLLRLQDLNVLAIPKKIKGDTSDQIRSHVMKKITFYEISMIQFFQGDWENKHLPTLLDETETRDGRTLTDTIEQGAGIFEDVIDYTVKSERGNQRLIVVQFDSVYGFPDVFKFFIETQKEIDEEEGGEK